MCRAVAAVYPRMRKPEFISTNATNREAATACHLLGFFRANLSVFPINTKP